MNSYNGYSSAERNQIGAAQRRGEGQLPTGQCAICANPDAPGWHSEDYSRPFLFAPPATFAICNACHNRLHNRFDKPAGEWRLFLRRIESGGYGREFIARFPLKARQAVLDTDELPVIRLRTLADVPWWVTLTLDPESLEAPWARPRPMRERPSAEAFRLALAAARPDEGQWSLLRAHAASQRRTATMRQLAERAWDKPDYNTANLRYGLLCKTLVRETGWRPDERDDGSPIWMSIAAEGWDPPRREFEWVMVGTLAEALLD